MRLIIALGFCLLVSCAAKAQCTGGPVPPAAFNGVPFNCVTGPTPQPNDLVLGGSQSQGALGGNKGTVAWSWSQVFNSPASSVTANGITNTLATWMGAPGTFSPMQYGAVGNGTADDTTAVQAALTAAVGGGTVILGDHLYGISSTLIVSKEKVLGNGGNGRTTGGLSGMVFSSGFVGLNATLQVLNVESDSVIEDIAIKFSGTQSAGCAIQTGATVEDIQFHRVVIAAPYNGMCINGNTVSTDLAMIVAPVANGIVIGNLTTGAGTVDPRITNTDVLGVGTSSGIYVEDAGGLYLENNDIIFGTYGTFFSPGANQSVQWTFAVNTVLGDTTAQNPLLIDTGAASASIYGLQFTNTWASNNTNGASIQIQNTGGGAVNSIWFNGHRTFTGGNSAGSSLVTILANVKDVSFDSSRLCGYPASGTGYGINFPNATAGPISIRNTEISNSCNGYFSSPGALAAAVNLTGATGATITGNDFTGATVPAVGTPGGISTIAGNRGLDNFTPTIATSATLALSNPNPGYYLTGTTTVTNITGVWDNRSVFFITGGGATSFNTGGGGTTGICNSVASAGALSTVTATYNAGLSCWLMK
jgi:hypothetical protein